MEDAMSRTKMALSEAESILTDLRSVSQGEIAAAVVAEREACLSDIEHEISAYGRRSLEADALREAQSRIRRRASR